MVRFSFVSNWSELGSRGDRNIVFKVFVRISRMINSIFRYRNHKITRVIRKKN